MSEFLLACPYDAGYPRMIWHAPGIGPFPIPELGWDLYEEEPPADYLNGYIFVKWSDVGR